MNKSHKLLNNCEFKKCLAVYDIKDQCFVRNKTLIKKFIIGLHNPENVIKKNNPSRLFEIWGDEDEDEIIRQLRRIDNRGKLSVRQMLKPIFHKPTFKYYSKNMGWSVLTKEKIAEVVKKYSNIHLFPKDAPSEESVSISVKKFFNKRIISSSFFELSDENFLKRINSKEVIPQKPKDNFEEGKNVINKLLLNFQISIIDVQFEFKKVQKESTLLKKYYVENIYDLPYTTIKIDKMLDYFIEMFRRKILEKFDKEEININYMYNSIEGFYLIIKELEKIIDIQKKLFGQEKIPKSNFDLSLDYWSAKSLHGGYVQALIFLSNDPKYDNYKSKVSMKKLGIYINDHKV